MFLTSRQYDPRWEELYTSGIAEGSIARRDAWKLLWLFVVPEYESRGVKRALLDVLAQKVSAFVVAACTSRLTRVAGRQRPPPSADRSSQPRHSPSAIFLASPSVHS